MNLPDFIKDYVFPLICIVGVPISFKIFRDIRAIELDQVALRKETEKLDDKIHHINGNYKQAIEHLNQEIMRMNADIHEMKADIKDLLKYIYKAGEPQR